MAAYAQDFQSKSQNLLGYVQSQLSQAVGWTPLPGQLNKIVASSAGFVWGFNTVGNFYMCKEPCDGTNWTQVANPAGVQGMPLDIAVDAQNVYVLYNAQVSSQPPTPPTASIGYMYGPWVAGHDEILKVDKDSQGNPVYIASEAPYTKLVNSLGVAKYYVGAVSDYTPAKWDSATTTPPGDYKVSLSPASSPPAPVLTNQLSFSTQPVDGTGSWSAPQPIPGTPPVNPEINITDQFIFVGNQGCSKPCTTGSWVPISGPQGSGQSLGVVAASSGSTYVPVNNAGKITVYSGTANGQGGWTPQPGLAGKIPVAVEADSQFLYAQDQGSGGVYRCGAPYSDVTSCQLEDTQGQTVSGNHTISVNPRSYQTYIAAASSGSVGNLYQRLDEGSVNVAPVLDQTKQYATQMDSDVNALGDSTTAQAAALSAAQTREQAMGVIQQITDLDDKFKETRIKQGNLRSKITNDQSVPLSTARLTALKVVAITLGCVIVLHVILGLFLSPTIVMGISLTALLIGVLVAYNYLGAGFKVSISSLKE